MQAEYNFGDAAAVGVTHGIFSKPRDNMAIPRLTFMGHPNLIKTFLFHFRCNGETAAGKSFWP